jgi:hypothetical protein
MSDGPCGTWKIRDVPTAEVENVMSDLRVDRPNSVTKEDQGGGLWTVIAEFDPCEDQEQNPPEMTHQGNG